MLFRTSGLSVFRNIKNFLWKIIILFFVGAFLMAGAEILRAKDKLVDIDKKG